MSRTFWKQNGIERMATPMMLLASVITWPDCDVLTILIVAE